MIALCPTALLWASVLLTFTCRAAPPSPLSADRDAERDSRDSNEVGPDENWLLYERFAKARPTGEAADAEQTRVLLKEIQQLSRLATSSPSTNVTDKGTGPHSDVTEPSDVTTEPSDATDPIDRTDLTDNWFGSTWRPIWGTGDDADASDFVPRSERQDDGGNVEDIIRKISNDLKKLYTKIKQVITVVKNWVNNARGSMSEFDAPYQMTGSASESDGVFVINDSLIGDVDKSNKYTVPINGDLD